MNAQKPEPKFGWQGDELPITEQEIADTLAKIQELSQQMQSQQNRLRTQDLAVFWFDIDEQVPERQTISFWSDSEVKFQEWYAHRSLAPSGIPREEAHNWMRSFQ